MFKKKRLKGTFTQNRYFLTTVTLLNIRKDAIKTVYVHFLGIFPTFLLRMNVSRYLLNVPIGKINIVQTFKKSKLSKLFHFNLSSGSYNNFKKFDSS